MPIFSRRRLQLMLDDLSDHVAEHKSKDLSRRIDSKKVDQSLPAEMELAILWAISNTGDIDIEPEWWADTRRPEAVSETIVRGTQIAVEVAAISDNSISPEDAMDRVACIIVEYCNSVSRTIGNHLYFRFGETKRYIEGKFFRQVSAPSDFQINEQIATKLTNWIKSDRCKIERIQLIGRNLFVDIEWTQQLNARYHNIWTSLPPEAYSLEENPLFQLLRRKSQQLRSAAKGILRIVVIADVGSTLLNQIGTASESDPAKWRISAHQILNHFITKHQSKIDGIIILSPRKRYGIGGCSGEWVTRSFPTDAGRTACNSLSEILKALPRPRFTGYQARSLFRQGLFSTRSCGWYLELSMETAPLDRSDPSRAQRHNVRMPARLFLDVMAGRITTEQLNGYLKGYNGEENIFARWLDSGLTLSGVEMAPRNPDEEDDHIILHFSDDPAARALIPRRAT